MSLLVPTTLTAGSNGSHCSCCHACHVSMKQRPRPLLACSSCNNIYCQVCLETRWKTDRWTSGLSLGDSWQCPKCTGDCSCKACSKGRSSSSSSSSSSRKRATPSSTSVSASVSEDGEFVVPVRAVAPRREADIYPGRQPAIPAGFQSALNNSNINSNSNVKSPRRHQLGLSMLLMDANTPMHRKALELAHERDRIENTIDDMKGLLSMLEQEKQVLDSSLDVLIKQAASSLGSMARTASVAQFEALLDSDEEELATPEETSASVQQQAVSI